MIVNALYSESHNLCFILESELILLFHRKSTPDFEKIFCTSLKQMCETFVSNQYKKSAAAVLDYDDNRH